jgi:hypothetical protein
VNWKYTDLSTFYALVYEDDKGSLKALNLPNKSLTDFPKFYVEQIKESISLLEKKGEYAKIIKRLFSLYKFTKNPDITKVAPFINSIYGLIGQLKSETAILAKLVDHTNMVGINKNIFINQLEQIKYKISQLTPIPEPEKEHMYKQLENINELIHFPLAAVETLNDLKDMFSQIANSAAYEYLKQINYK